MEPEPVASDPARPARTDRGGSSLFRSMLAVFVAVLVLFGVYEVVERIWLSEADHDLLRLLHRVRGALAATITLGVAGWLILREGPPLLAAGPLPAESGGAVRIDPEQKRIHYARWFIIMRWIAVVVAMLAVIVAVELAGLLPRQVGPSLAGIIAWLMLLNLSYSVYLRHVGASNAFLAVQVYIDLVVLILLLHFSGGIENPLTPLLLLHVIIAGIVLGRLQAYLVAGVASTLFAAMAWAECTGFLPHYTLTVFPHVHIDDIMLHAAHDPFYASSRVALQTLVLLLVAYFTTTLVERIRGDERHLETLADGARAQAQMLERALDTTDTALCLCDRDLRPYWSNNRWAEWTQAEPELRCSVTADGSPARSTLADGFVRSAEIRTGEQPITRSVDGRSATAAPDRGVATAGRVFHLTTAPLRDRDGGISHVVALARDVTEQHHAQARVVRAERLAAVGELAGQVAHEVNNPIAIISAKARLLLREGRDALPSRAALEVGKMADLADRVARIAQGLLSYCRPAPGERVPLDVRLPLRRAMAYLDARAKGTGVSIRDELPDRLPLLYANAAELEQVFLNLFLNALDAMPDGGQLRVSACTAAAPVVGAQLAASAASAVKPVALTIRIADTGTGIPPDIRPRVFEPFLTTKGGKGSGLGLSICQGIVRSHGGEIEIGSRAGGGTVVVLTLPLPEATPANRPLAAQQVRDDA